MLHNLGTFCTTLFKLSLSRKNFKIASPFSSKLSIPFPRIRLRTACDIILQKQFLLELDFLFVSLKRNKSETRNTAVYFNEVYG
jgi:hypothetical protein